MALLASQRTCGESAPPPSLPAFSFMGSSSDSLTDTHCRDAGPSSRSGRPGRHWRWAVGFFFGADEERALGEDLGPTITAGEYRSAMAGVLEALTEGPRGRGHPCGAGFRALAAGLAGRATLVFSAHVQRYPS